MKELSLSAIEKNISGIYMIVFPNNKIYIGLSNDIKRRMREHNQDFRVDLPISRAIKKYGKIEKFYLLEEIDAENRKLLQEREKYWIAYYHSNEKDIGYNLTSGGDGTGAGAENISAKFTEEEIQMIYYDIKNHPELKLQDLAKKYNISVGAISEINNGKTYFHKNETYPLRNGNSKLLYRGANNCRSVLTQDQADEIYELLKNTKISMKQIAQDYGVSSGVIQNINRGKGYFSEKNIYPLRKTFNRKKKNE